jgi:hypothetical protein
MVNGLSPTRWGISSFVLLLGCASTAPMVAEDTPVSPATDEAAASPAPPPASRRAGEAIEIAGPDALVGLCRTLRDPSAPDFSGNAVEQARAAAAHDDRRQAALAASYVTVIPSNGFAFRGYQMSDHRLVLDTDRNFILGEGAELFANRKDELQGFSLPPDLAERLLGEHANGRLGLRLIFRPARSEMRKDGCIWLSGGHVVKMDIDVVAAALLGADGALVARGDAGDYGDPTAGLPVRSPKVTVKRPRDHEGKELLDVNERAFAPLSRAAQSCYQRALLVRPALRGTMALAVHIGEAGRIDEARVEISSLADDAVTACVVAAANKTTLSGLPSGQRYSIPLQFGSADDR